MVLSEQEKAAIIRRYVRGEAHRSIAKNEHHSLRDVAAAIKEHKENLEKSLEQPVSKVTRLSKIASIVDAFREFEKGTRLEVVFIKLQMEDTGLLKKWYFQYLDLKGAGMLKSLYEKVGGNRIVSVADLIIKMEKDGVSNPDLLKHLKDVRDFPILSKEVEALRAEKGSMPAMHAEHEKLRAEITTMREELNELIKKHLEYRQDILPQWMSRHLVESLDRAKDAGQKSEASLSDAKSIEIGLIGCRYGQKALIDTLTVLAKNPERTAELLKAFRPNGTYTRIDLNFEPGSWSLADSLTYAISEIESKRMVNLARAPEPPMIKS